MTKAELTTRLAALKNGEAACLKAIEDARANLISQRGAIQECEFWLSQPEPEKPALPSLAGEDYPKLPVAGEA